MKSRDAERYALLVWDAIKTMMASEVAAQETLGQTPLDFDMYAQRYLTETLVLEKIVPLGKRIDFTSGPSGEEETGEYYFGRPENLQLMTYTQAMIGLRRRVPLEYRRKFKQLHADGASAYQAYKLVVEAWEGARAAVLDRAGLSNAGGVA